MLKTIIGFLLRLFGYGGKSAPVVLNNVPPGISEESSLLYEGEALAITADEISAAKAYLHFVKDGRKVGPTPAQEAIIFSTAAGVSVLAGAGSGKSTTLVSRILFLHVIKNVPLEQIAVFTFTRKSRFDFIDRLKDEAKRWGVTGLTQKKAESIVRTFHSKALQMSRGFRSESMFEFLGESPKKSTGDAEEGGLLDADVVAANDVEGFVKLDTTDEQEELLKEAYIRRYNGSVSFRRSIETLFTYTLTSEKTLPTHDYDKRQRYLAKMARDDSAVCQHLEEQWTSQHGWPIPGISTTMPNGGRYPIQIGQHTFYANGFIPKLNVYVVLGRYGGITPDDVLVNGATVKPAYAVKNKTLVLLTDAKENIRYVHNPRDLEKLRDVIETATGPQGMAAPALALKLPGEFKPAPAFSALFNLGGFAESLALQPDALDAVLEGRLAKTPERAAVSAVSEFYAEFFQILEERGLTTFNQVFAQLGKGSSALAKVDSSALQGVKHLMIDEFQDIAPLIVNFVLGVQGQMKSSSTGNMKPSLMCVGDDWQSIYGWRGSSPHFMLCFDRAFPGAKENALLLEDNFRSSQHIINCGESFIKKVQSKSSKRGIAANPSVKNLKHRVVAVEEFSSTDVLSSLKLLLGAMPRDDKVYVLAATHENLSEFKRLRDDRLMLTTFHQSKGLEADYVVLIGAPRHFGSNPIKNALYAVAEFPQSFDDAQADEAFRVAYVAATRAKKLCIWYADPKRTVLDAVPVDLISRERMIQPEVESLLRNVFETALQLA